VGPLRLSAGDLRASDGTLLGARTLRFDPPEAAVLPARSARGVVLSLAAEEPLEPATYRGVVQAEGAQDLWVTLEIEVRSRPS
jgi:hypothetical protein